MAHDENPQNRQTRPYKSKKMKPFLEAFRQCGTISRAAKAVGINRDTVLNWRNQDSEFEKLFINADCDIADELEAHAIERATTGVRKTVYFRGTRIGETIEKSDTLLMFLLRARRPELYRDKCEHDRVEELKQFGEKISGQFVNILNKTVTDCCPHCKSSLDNRRRITEELELRARNKI
jgi:hypothetical protein